MDDDRVAISGIDLDFDRVGSIPLTAAEQTLANMRPVMRRPGQKRNAEMRTHWGCARPRPRARLRLLTQDEESREPTAY